MCKKVSTSQNSLGGHQWKMFEEPVQQDFLTSTLLTFGANGSFLWRVTLCIAGCSPASLVSPHHLPVTTPLPQL